MTRISDITDRDELEVEFQREELRRRIWHRWGVLLLMIATAIAVVLSSLQSDGLLPTLLRWIA